MRIRKLTQTDPRTGGFDGEIIDPHIENAAGDRVPNIPHLSSLFMYWENDVELVDEGSDVVQSFVVSDTGRAEFASRTLSQLVHSFAGLGGSPVSWRAIVHDTTGHLAHDIGRLRALVDEGARYGVITDILNFHPRHVPSFVETAPT